MRARGVLVGFARASAIAAVVVLAACSGDDDATDGTLGVIPAGSSGTGPQASGQPIGTAPPGTGVDPGTAGSGFVSIGVQLASAGIAETLSLDRSTVAADALDAVTLDAICTPLDGGDPANGVRIAVVDLARLASGDRLVSAELRYPDAAPGEHEMTLQLGAAEQVSTTYTGTVNVGGDGLSGTFSGTDGEGMPVSGSFACATQAIVTTTTAVPVDAGEEVPEDVAPTTSTAAPG